jgi:hypothetical protein
MNFTVHAKQVRVASITRSDINISEIRKEKARQTDRPESISRPSFDQPLEVGAEEWHSEGSTPTMRAGRGA